ncbi:phage tail domain-containing protein [Bacillus sp. ISL-46]|uniref:phage distal tail protein n=1 Tax=Bacillus sp. ISL-46 TaxID=2819129 RepID=UPI001BE7C792|nr:phage tail domain-containing protein [Bacillus sp. ISL-46]MBT2722319.1 phage tail family protein [Bacillus sp. ISL-46]
MDKISWIDSQGTEYPLTFQDNFSVLSTSGLFMPQIEFVEEEAPFQSGSRLRNIQVKPRDVDVQLFIKCESEIELRQKVRDCLRMFNPLTGDGKLKVTAPDDSQRELICRYKAGLEGTESKDSKGRTWKIVLLIFRAFDPFWHDSNTIVQTFKINESPGTFFPIFPLRLSSSTVFADISIENTGDVETWPEWIITGPGENIVLRNMSTGDVMNLETSLGVGETITIDTNPYAKTVTKNDGANLFYTLIDESSLWSLQEGENSIQLEMANATTESSIQLTYRNRYWGP